MEGSVDESLLHQEVARSENSQGQCGSTQVGRAGMGRARENVVDHRNVREGLEKISHEAGDHSGKGHEITDEKSATDVLGRAVTPEGNRENDHPKRIEVRSAHV